ncbi:hypothetical protein ACHAWO_014009 [Cyclotella atomus]|uniref:Saccharopine dehydrogenase NADP binding domain-containing protein n=1 Tax=Cyclotella atomus TaxID=382360 RepID=A0ABD3QLR6_9STRA
MNKKILVLGGYGSTGKHICHYLLQESNADVIVAGRDLSKGEALATDLNVQFGKGRVTAIAADASNAESLNSAFDGVDMVVVASSTVKYTEIIARACIKAGADYFDVNVSDKKNTLLRKLAPEMKEAGLCFVTDGGFHPGVPAALVRYAAKLFDEPEHANVGSVIQVDWKQYDIADATAEEMMTEFLNIKSSYYRNGKWHKPKMWGMFDLLKFDFGKPFGKQECFPMQLDEMKSLPEEIPSLLETGFYIGGLNWFTDWFVFPIAMVGMKISKRFARPLGRWMLWSMRKFSSPPYGTILRLEARGTKGGQPYALFFQLEHQDGYVFTAIPAVACLLQLLDGSIRKPGLHWQALAVQPERFLADMERMGIEMKGMSPRWHKVYANDDDLNPKCVA